MAVSSVGYFPVTGIRNYFYNYFFSNIPLALFITKGYLPKECSQDIMIKATWVKRNAPHIWLIRIREACLPISQWRTFGLTLNASNPSYSSYSFPRCIHLKRSGHKSFLMPQSSICIHSRQHRECLGKEFIGMCNNSSHTVISLSVAFRLGQSAESRPWTGSCWIILHQPTTYSFH